MLKVMYCIFLKLRQLNKIMDQNFILWYSDKCVALFTLTTLNDCDAPLPGDGQTFNPEDVS